MYDSVWQRYQTPLLSMTIAYIKRLHYNYYHSSPSPQQAKRTRTPQTQKTKYVFVHGRSYSVSTQLVQWSCLERHLSFLVPAQTLAPEHWRENKLRNLLKFQPICGRFMG